MYIHLLEGKNIMDKNQCVIIRLTPQEKEILRLLAKKHSMTISQFIRTFIQKNAHKVNSPASDKSIAVD